MVTTSTSPYRPLRALAFFLLLIVALLAFLAIITVITHDHAIERHGGDARLIRQCLDNKGPYQIWRARDAATFYRLCQLDDGRWGMQAIVKEGDAWHEKTAFVRGDGSWNALVEYLQRFTTRFTGSLP